MAAPLANASKPVKAVPEGACSAVTVQGEVGSGEAFRQEFTPGLELFVEPLKSGWIVRVLEMRQGHEVREPHDWAEVATPPYRSVSPLLISTDWAFRAQDAGAWNPRHFRYAVDRQRFDQLVSLEQRVLAKDGSAMNELARLVVTQPEARFQLMDVELVPGLRDQAPMAASVASRWADTPHEVVQGEPPSALGRLARIRFKVWIELPRGAKPAGALVAEHFSCDAKPTR